MASSKKRIPTARVEAPRARAKILSQSDFPTYSIEKSLLIPRAIVDNFAGRGGEPNQIALAMNWTPTSGSWRMLCGSAIAYGLTEGGYAATEIKMTARASAIVAPTDEDGGRSELRDALLGPSIMRAFIEKYDGAKFPAREIGINVLAGLGLPRERAPVAFGLIEENLRFSGALQQTKTGQMVMLSMIGGRRPSNNSVISASADVADDPTLIASPAVEIPAMTPRVAEPPSPSTSREPDNKNVFISHGKNRELVEHLKKLVTFVKLVPVVSVEITETSKPVPQKVMDEMRSCFGGIVHVRSEGELIDTDGKKQTKLNDNVLIEIGAAMAIYRNNFILLVEKGILLPSNLQGLFVCHYEGDRMDGDATMRLLEGLNKFKP